MFAQTSKRHRLSNLQLQLQHLQQPRLTTITMSERRQSVVGEVVSLVFLGLSVLLSYKWYKKMFKEPVNNKLVHVLPHTPQVCTNTRLCTGRAVLNTHTCTHAVPLLSGEVLGNTPHKEAWPKNKVVTL